MYLYLFRIYSKDGSLTNNLQQGTSFTLIKTLYDFDNQLRLLLFEALTAVELSLRRQIAYSLSLDRSESHPVIFSKTTQVNMFEEVYQKFASRQKDTKAE